MQKQWSDALFKNSNAAIAILDKNYKIMDINKKFSEKFGYKLSKIKGIPLDDVIEKGKSGSADREMAKEEMEYYQCRLI
ncbi:MAG: PAS domain-containing protein [Bacillota bacterium]